MRLCDYGCGQEAKHQFKNGKRCCSKSFNSCPKIRKKYSESLTGLLVGDKNGMFGKSHTTQSKEIMRSKKLGNITSDETKEKQRIANLKENSYLWKGGYYTKGVPMYDTYSKQLGSVEEHRRNKTDDNILEIRCAYCGIWFIPSIVQIHERVRSIKNFGGARLYCSDKCKIECPIFRQHKYPKGFKISTSREVQPELRQMRFELDNYTCQKCYKNQKELDVPLHCHHIEGIRWDPLESADIDKCITYCKTCHLKVHKKEGCGYHELQCKEK